MTSATLASRILKKLDEEKQRLMVQLDRPQSTIETPFGCSHAEQASEVFDASMDQTLRANSLKTLGEITRAIARWERDSQKAKLCERCRCEIGDERLLAQPWATFCVLCAEEVQKIIEREERAKHERRHR